MRGSVKLEHRERHGVILPVFSLSDGDEFSLKAERASDGVLRVAVRGDVFDGTNFVKSSLVARTSPSKTDLNLDIELRRVVGHNGETLRGLDLNLIGETSAVSR